jgi:diguanylate cyclase (GGDEF)-like protein
MKVNLAAVLEPVATERKRLAEGLKRAGLKVSPAQDARALRKEQLVVLGPGLKGAARLAREVRQAHPGVLILAAQKRVTKAAHADGVLPLPLSPLDLKVRLPELAALRARAPRVTPAPRPGEGILDPLTGFYTFAHFKEVVFVEVKRARRYGFPLSIALISFDPGTVPAKGDGLRPQLFGGLALAIRRSLRDTDYPVQYGPDRVLLLMPHTDLQGALVVSRRICERVARASLTHGDTVIRPTISVGVSATPSQGGEVSFADMARQAQLSLDEALGQGGNRVEFWDSAVQAADAESAAASAPGGASAPAKA